MSTENPAVLALLRDACRTLTPSLPPDQVPMIERIALVLTRMLVEQRDLGARDFARGAGATGVVAEQRWFRTFREKMQAELAAPPRGVASVGGDDPNEAQSLQSWLREAFDDRELGVRGVSVASRGFSKKTLLVNVVGSRSLPEQLAVRVDQAFNYLGTRVVDEYPALRLLFDRGVPVARPLAVEPTGAVLGQPFMVSERVGGAPVGSAYVFPPPNDALLREVAEAYAKLHAVPVDDFRAAVPHALDPEAALDAEIARYRREWQALAMHSPTVEAGFRWIDEHRQDGLGESAVTHTDLSLSNMLVESDRVTALLDWEFVHPGHPSADIGYFFYAAEALGSFERFIDAYVGAGGRRVSRESLDFYVLWGQLRLLIMGFQVEVGFQQGRFDDLRFALGGIVSLPLSMERVTTRLLGYLGRDGRKGS